MHKDSRECNLSAARSVGDKDFLRVNSWACSCNYTSFGDNNYALFHVAYIIAVNTCILTYILYLLKQVGSGS